MRRKKHSTCKLPPFLLKRAKDRKKKYLLNVFSVINGIVYGFPFFFSCPLVGKPNKVQ